jgi:hypothetical protein
MCKGKEALGTAFFASSAADSGCLLAAVADVLLLQFDVGLSVPVSIRFHISHHFFQLLP